MMFISFLGKEYGEEVWFLATEIVGVCLRGRSYVDSPGYNVIMLKTGQMFDVKSTDNEIRHKLEKLVQFYENSDLLEGGGSDG